jgi:hypothetical protein
MNRLLVALLLSSPAFAQDPDRVTMRLEDFLRLYEQSARRPPEPGKPPVDATLSDIAWTATVQTDAAGEPTAALLTARVRVDRHGTGWGSIPLLAQGASLISATLDGKPAPISLRDGWYQLVTNRTGALDLALELALPITTDQGVSAFSMPLVAAGSSTLSLSLPSSGDLDVTVARARVLKDQVIGGRRLIEASFPSQDSLAVRWQRRTASDAAQQQPRVYASVQTLVGVGDGLLTAQVAIDNTILFAGVDTFRYDLPDGMTVLDVTGAGLREWTIDTKGDLVVHLAFAAEDHARFNLTLERAIGEGSRAFDAPLLTPLGVERIKGFVGVTASGGLEVAAGDVQGAAPVDVRTLPADVLGMTRQPVLLGYKYLGDAAKLPLQVTQHDAVDVLVTLLDRAEATTMFTIDGRRLTQVRYDVRNNRRQFLRLRLPPGAQLWSAAVAGAAVQPSRGADGTLLLPLVRSADQGGALSAFPVEVVYVDNGDPTPANGAGHFEAQLPIADVPTTWVGWTVYAPEGSKVSPRAFEGSLRPVSWLSRPAAAEEMMVVDAAQQVTRSSADNQLATGGMGSGATPVRVELPLEGVAFSFEKLLVLDETLWVGFDYRGAGQR